MDRVLIIKIGAIGDVLMCLPAALSLSESGVKVDWSVGTIPFSFVKEQKFNTVNIINEKNLFGKNLFYRFIEIFKFWIKLFGKNYDLIFIGHTDRRYKALVLPLIFFKKIKMFNPVIGKHHTLEYFKHLYGDSLGAEKFEKFKSQQNQMSKVKTKKIIRIGISPGGAKNILADDWQRRWPVEQYADLLRKINNEFDCSVEIFGSPSDDWVLQYFSHLKIVNHIGSLGLIEFRDYLKENIDLFITHDSGPMHIAVNSGIPIYSIFGATDPHEKIYQNHPDSRIFWNKDASECVPCYDGKNYIECDHHSCMKSISSDEILSNLKDFINR